MRLNFTPRFIASLIPLTGLFGGLQSQAGEVKVLTNHAGYDVAGPKHAVILAKAGDSISTCAVKDDRSDQPVLSVDAQATGPVKNWRNWHFWTLEFDQLTSEGRYYIECASSRGMIRSFPFAIQRYLLERDTLSHVIYYFKGQRSSGEMDKADRHLPLYGPDKHTLDAHGGWYDAAGDYSKNFSHLSFTTYFNPQQTPLVAYTLFKSYEEIKGRGLPVFVQYERRLLDEAMFGADYLVRVKVPSGSFYRAVAAPGGEKKPEDRRLAGAMRAYSILRSREERRQGAVDPGDRFKPDQVSYRAGGGVAIAALAMASAYPLSGEFQNADYLKAAQSAFDYLEKDNLTLTNDGKENIIDDYCALTAAVELFKATHDGRYKAAADRRAKSLMGRLVGSQGYQNYWRADDGDRPFFHPTDAGFPAVSLLYYADIADEGSRREAIETVRKSLVFELAVTREVNNPFGYSRQLVQDKTGARRTAFFFPHNTETAPWWQGENARLASLAAAARLAMRYFKQDPAFTKQLQGFATDQLNWILGLNPFDSSMLTGVGHNNPRYMFFDSWEFVNAPGSISNGITSGFRDENDIDYLVPYAQTGADNDWRWSEQWLPHAAWYLLAVSIEAARPQ